MSQQISLKLTEMEIKIHIDNYNYLIQALIDEMENYDPHCHEYRCIAARIKYIQAAKALLLDMNPIHSIEQQLQRIHF